MLVNSAGCLSFLTVIDLKHIAGSKNTVADALSRDPFAKTVSRLLITGQYGSQLSEAESVDKV